MTINNVSRRDYTQEATNAGDAPRLAGAAALLEIGDRLGLLDHLEPDRDLDAATLADATGVPRDGVANWLEAAESAGLLRASGDGRLRTVGDFDRIKHQAGFLSWALNANRPFIEHCLDYLTDHDSASLRFRRDGRQVAVTSQWMGSMSFYSAARDTILEANPSRVVDLGAGTCRLLIDILRSIPTATALGLDLDGPACAAAAAAAERAGVADRLTVVERPIQSIATDPGPVEGADVIHGGFVFHDMMPEEEDIADQVLAQCRDVLAPGGIMAITDATPYPRDERERSFGAIVTYFHRQFMRRKLLTPEEWRDKLLSAKFSSVECVELAFPSGRLHVARK